MLVKPNLNKPIFVIFPELRQYIENEQCPNCQRKILEEDFRDELSKKEYTFSGLCQACQNKIFGKKNLVNKTRKKNKNIKNI